MILTKSLSLLAAAMLTVLECMTYMATQAVAAEAAQGIGPG
jgi:hypothetical protein